MRVGVLGGGWIGKGVARRLTTLPFVAELHWFNRTRDRIEADVIDLEHGLSLVPCCRRLRAHDTQATPRNLELIGSLDALVLTVGTPVPRGAERAATYRDSLAVIDGLRPLLAAAGGVVLVVTNPVDLIARHVATTCGVAPDRVLGLGTIVETARLRAAIAARLIPSRPAREIWACAVGTHDRWFVALRTDPLAIGTELDPDEAHDVVEAAGLEVRAAAERVKGKGQGTLHPIVEGTAEVLRAIAHDSHELLTVSVLDPDTDDQLYYSVPCRIGRRGLVERVAVGCPDLATCLAELRRVIAS